MQSRGGLTDFENRLMVAKGYAWEERNGLGVWDWHIHTEVYGIIGLQGPAVSHRELYAIFCVGEESEKEWMCVHV